MNANRTPFAAVFAISLGLGGGCLGQTACNAAAFGPVTQDPIMIAGAWTIGNNCTLNFGFRHVILGPSAALAATNATIIAGQLTMQSGSLLSANSAPGSVTIATIPGGSADGSVLIGGVIDLGSAPAGGTAMINAGSSVSITGAGARINAHGAGSGSAGGRISILAAGSVTVDGHATTLDAQGFDAHGGMITIQSLGASVAIPKALAASGLWQGGAISITSATTLSTSAVLDATVTVTSQSPPPQLGQGGSIALHAGTDLSINGDLRSNVEGLFPCGGSYGTGGPITLFSGGFTNLNANANLQGGGLAFGQPQGGVFTATAGGDYTQSAGSSVLASSPEFSGSGGVISINAGGAIQLLGSHVAGTVCDFDSPGNRGRIDIHGTGDVQVAGPLVNSGGGIFSPNYPYALAISSSQGDVTLLGNVSLGGFAGSTLTVDAARNLAVNGSVSGQYNLIGCCPGWNMSFTAGGDVSLAGSIDASLDGTASVTIAGCRVSLLPGSMVNVDDYYGVAGSVTITARDLLTAAGTISGISYQGGPGSEGSVSLVTRLGAPHSPLLAGSSITPAPAIVHDNMLLPCLALQTAALTGPTHLNPGDPFIVNFDSVSSKPVVVVGALSLQHLSLAALGWTQVNPFGMNVVVLADPGVLGAPLPGSMTDAAGHWGVAIPTAGVPGLSGLTIYVDAYVIDPNAANGAFHQPPYLAIQFL